MNAESKIGAVLSEVVSCPLRCAGIRNEPIAGVIPRSFYFSRPLKRIEILVIGKNPGTTPPWEAQIYRETESTSRMSRHLQIVKELLHGTRSVQTVFHTNLLRRVGGVLGVEPTPEQVFRHAALTALVKCESSASKTASLPPPTIDTCAKRYLIREIQIYRPVYLLALGGEVFTYLTSPGVADQHGLPVGNLYHPSWSNMKGGESKYFETEIPRLREEYLRAASGA